MKKIIAIFLILSFNSQVFGQGLLVDKITFSDGSILETANGGGGGGVGSSWDNPYVLTSGTITQLVDIANGEYQFLNVTTNTVFNWDFAYDITNTTSEIILTLTNGQNFATTWNGLDWHQGDGVIEQPIETVIAYGKESMLLIGRELDNDIFESLPTDGLLSEYLFETGFVGLDNLGLQNFSLFGQVSSTNGVAYFDGSGDYLQADEVFQTGTYNTTNWALSVWVSVPTAINRALFEHSNSVGSTSVNAGLRMYNLNWVIQKYTGATVDYVDIATVDPTGAWHHIVYANQNNLINVWYDGARVVTDLGAVNRGGSDLYIGSFGGGAYMQGGLYRLRIYEGTSINDASASALYSEGAPE